MGKCDEHNVMENELREITITIWHTPIAKQSTKFGYNKHIGRVMSYTAPEKKSAEKEYTKQIKNQLPEDFEMFTEQVEILESLLVYPPLKSFTKKKKKIIEDGEFIPKTTRPDLVDNLHKLPLDCLSGLVYKDDGLIWRANNLQKVHGIEGYTKITLRGK